MKEQKRIRLIAKWLGFFTAYFVLAVLVVFGLVNLFNHFSISVPEAWLWTQNHALLAYGFILLIVVVSLAEASHAYRRQLQLSKLDYKIWLEQRSTRTSLSFMLPVHDWLRLHFRPYRWWHTQVVSTLVNALVLLVVVFALGAKINNEATGLKTIVAGACTFITGSPANATHYSVSGIPSPITAGTAATVTVTALDSSNATATCYGGTVHFSSSDGQAGLPANYQFLVGDHGIHTFSNGVVLKTAGTQSVTATDTGNSSITGSQTGIQVNAASVNNLRLTGAPSSVTAGNSFSLTVTAKDAYNNNASGFTDRVGFSTTNSQANLPADYTFVGGDGSTHNFNSGFTLKTAGTSTVTVSDKDNSALTSTTSSITINPASPASYTFSGVGTQTVGVGWSQTISAKDAYGNNATNSTLTLTPSSNGSARYYTSSSYSQSTSRYTFTAGSATTFVVDQTAETVILKVTDGNGVNGSSAAIVVSDSGSGGGGSGGGGSGGGGGGSGGGGSGGGGSGGGSGGSGGGSGGSGSGGSGGGGGSSGPITTSTVKNALHTLVGQPTADGSGWFTPFLLSILTLLSLPTITAPLLSSIINILANGASILSLLYLPFIRRKNRWGIVTNAQTHLPIAGVFVELGDESGRIVGRVMTDRSGSYGFLVERPGKYFVQIKNPLYQAYISTFVAINDPQKDIVAHNIALTPIEVVLKHRIKEVAFWSVCLKIYRGLAISLLAAGTLITILALLQQVTPLRVLTIVLYLFLWLSQFVIYLYKRPFGKVVDAVDNRVQPMTVVQLVDKKDLTIARSTITGSSGRFLFAVAKGDYMLVSAKPGYDLVEKPVTEEKVNIILPIHRRAASVSGTA